MNFRLFFTGFFCYFMLFLLLLPIINLASKTYGIDLAISPGSILFYSIGFSMYPLFGKKYWQKTVSITLDQTKASSIKTLLLVLNSLNFKIDDIDITSSKIKAIPNLTIGHLRITEVTILFSETNDKSTTLLISLATNSFNLGMSQFLNTLTNGLILLSHSEESP